MVQIIQKLITNQANFTRGRRGKDVLGIVLHTEGVTRRIDNMADRSLFRWFNTNDRGVSAHYYVTFSGLVEQYVLDEDTAHQAGNWQYNLRTIGIEHQDNGYWRIGEARYTDAEYEASAQLVALVCQQFNIPILHITDPQSFAGIRVHKEVPEAATGCPRTLDFNRIILRAAEIASSIP